MLPFVNLLETEFGKYMTFSGRDCISRYLFINGHWEITHIKISELLIHNNQHYKNVIDIGANLGAFTVPVALRTLGKVYSFEPQRIIFQQLCGNCFLNRLDNVIAYNFAIGNPKVDNEVISVPVRDYTNESNIGGISLDPEIRKIDDIKHSPILYYENIELRSIDSFNLKEIALIKIDVEGMEESVLRGSVYTLKQNNYPPILFEMWADEWYREQRKSLTNFLFELGYDSIQRFGQIDWLAQHKSQLNKIIINQGK